MPALPNKLSLVAVPLGNPLDLSTRARNAIAEAGVIFCEDTRKSQELLRRADLSSSARWVALPGNREHEVSWAKYAADGAALNWVFMSDAGTPILNDPGAGILEFCRSRQIPIEALPGPSAPILAYQWSGGFGTPLCFAGYAPKAKSATSKDLETFFHGQESCATFIFFDTRHQIGITLAHLVQFFPERKLFIAREMTKSHEELISGTPTTCQEWLRERLEKDDPIGELTLVFEGAHEKPRAKSSLQLEDLIKIRTLPTKAAAKVAAELLGVPVREVYQAFCEEK